MGDYGRGEILLQLADEAVAASIKFRATFIAGIRQRCCLVGFGKIESLPVPVCRFNTCPVNDESQQK